MSQIARRDALLSIPVSGCLRPLDDQHWNPLHDGVRTTANGAIEARIVQAKISMTGRAGKHAHDLRGELRGRKRHKKGSDFRLRLQMSGFLRDGKPPAFSS
jgi:hypothetical protein